MINRAIIALTTISVFLQVSCSSSSKLSKPITYKLFDSLEHFIGIRMQSMSDPCFLIENNCSYCIDYYPEFGSYGLAIAVIEKKDLELPNHKYIIEHTNRMVKINEHQYPAFIIGIDDYFTDPLDSVNLSRYIMWGRELRYSYYIHWIYFNSSAHVFYDRSDITPRGK